MTAPAWAAMWAAVRLVVVAAGTMAASAAREGRWGAAVVAGPAGSREEGRAAYLAAAGRKVARGARGVRAGALAEAAWAAACCRESSARPPSILRARRSGNCCAARSKTPRSRRGPRGGRRCTARGFGIGFGFLGWAGARRGAGGRGGAGGTTHQPQRLTTLALFEMHPVSADEHSHTCQRLKLVRSRPGVSYSSPGFEPSAAYVRSVRR